MSRFTGNSLKAVFLKGQQFALLLVEYVLNIGLSFQLSFYFIKRAHLKIFYENVKITNLVQLHYNYQAKTQRRSFLQVCVSGNDRE